MTIHPIDTIMSDPAVRNGQPVVAGTTIRVIDVIASHLYRGLNADELATNFRMNLGQVYAVLAYYYQNSAEVDSLMAADEDKAFQLLKAIDKQGKLIRIE